MKWFAVALCAGSALASSLGAQQEARRLVTAPIDENNLAMLPGSMHPLARPGNDRGAVADSFGAERILLLLNRPSERAAALESFLSDVHTSGSTSFHLWLTSEEFGERFGPAEADIDTVSRWLGTHGMHVTRVAKSRQFVEFSATAGQLREAFHTEIHSYKIGDEMHYANASPIRIPEALAALIRGISPLNDFRAQPQLKIAGRAMISRETRPTAPEWTAPNQYGTPNAYQFTVTPADLATQYDLAPLYSEGKNGAGQTIGIINESNIDLNLVTNFQKLFGIAAAAPQVVIDGDDPGVISEGSVDTEAYLDVELSGAIAPKAAVNLYIANAGNLIDPLELAALRAVEDNQASVLSVSFGACEANLGDAGNLFWTELWEQAAAQGQTVLVSSGDFGSECSEGTPSVNGLASTPWNVSVGGTDFYYSDYATGGESANGLWNAKNTPQLGSLKAPIEEQAWNDGFGLDIIADGIQRNEFYAGGGGKSNCTTQKATTQECISGHPRPAWQVGKGVPADRYRHLPDVSLFASNGANLSAYAICAYEGECAPGSGAKAEVLLTGGTSASAPAMAGIMALVDQLYGRQGQANFTLYPLAAKMPRAFHDITMGSNSVPCGHAITPTCKLQANGYLGSTQYKANVGYDQASGLGSVDASVLVKSWNVISFKPTETKIGVSTARITHGAPVTVSTSVSAAPSAGSGTPTGEVAILATTALPANQSQFFIPLSKGTGKSAVRFLPGGAYHLMARYGGDTKFAASTSKMVGLTVEPENSNINFAIGSGASQISSGSSVPFGEPVELSIQPAGVSGADGIATGSAKFSVDADSSTVALNSAGAATWLAPALSVGSHAASASYTGDASFRASKSAPVAFSVVPGQAFIHDTVIAPYTIQKTSSGEILPWFYLARGSAMTVSVSAQGQNTFGAGAAQIPLNTPAPTGTVTICLGTSQPTFSSCASPAYMQTAKLAALNGNQAIEAVATATFPNLMPNNYWVSATYNGDPNWASTSLGDIQEYIVESLPPLAPTMTALRISTKNIAGAKSAIVTAKVVGTGKNGVSPGGTINFYADDVFVGYAVLTSTAGKSSSVSFALNANSFPTSGSNRLVANYEGDGVNGPSMSNAIMVQTTQTVGDFTLAPEIAQIAIAPKGSGSALVNLGSLGGFNGIVALSCAAPSPVTCSVSPAEVALHGAATAKVAIGVKTATAGTYGVVIRGSANRYLHDAKIGVVIP